MFDLAICEGRTTCLKKLLIPLIQHILDGDIGKTKLRVFYRLEFLVIVDFSSSSFVIFDAVYARARVNVATPPKHTIYIPSRLLCAPWAFLM